MTTVIDSHKGLQAFCNWNKLTYLIFRRTVESTCLCKMLHKVYPDLTFAYELGVDKQPEPFYHTLTQININQNNINSDKPISFYIQTISDHNDTGRASKIYDIVIGNSIDEIMRFYNYMVKVTTPPTVSKKNSIFMWSSYHGQYIEDMKTLDRSIDDLIGLEEYFDLVKNDVLRQDKHQELLSKLGATSGLNYMLYGTPGTGKSSFVRAFATAFEIPIYVVKLTQAVNETQLTKMLIPDTVAKHATSLKLVLLEDFDRYLENNKENKAIMSAILNAFDGVFSAINIVRFFSANNPEIINKNGALVSRMNRTFLFDLPNKNFVKEQIKRVYGKDCNRHIMEELAIKMEFNKLSMRHVTNYLCRFLDEEHKLEQANAQFDDYIDEMTKFHQYRDEYNKN